MASFRIGLLAVILCMGIVNADDLIVGSTTGELGYTQTINLSAIPSDQRTEYVYWYTNSNTKLIKGISAIDLNKSRARAMIKNGGIDQNYVKLKIKSDHDEGLNYLVQIYV